MTATTTETVKETKVRRHPVRAALWGALAGLGVALMLIDRAVIALGTMAPFVCILLGIVVFEVWAFVAPPRKLQS